MDRCNAEQLISVVLLVTGLLAGCSDQEDFSAEQAGPIDRPAIMLVNHEAAEVVDPEETIDFSRDILPILSNSCYHCHGPDQDSKEAKQAGFRMDDRDQAIEMFAIVPGDPEASEAINRVTTSRSTMRMPPLDSTKPQLTPEQVDLLRRWIEQGAAYTDHWSFVKPTKPELPEVSDPSWPSNGIDHFIHRGLEDQGLTPMPEADKRRLIRRVSLDLIGLPPTPEEVEAFVNDESEDAYEKVVDRLLASQHFGEQWARPWLDNARYADSQGFEKDRPRTMWRYRDWVIGALNRDMPFDQFTRDQLAGDMVENPTTQQLIATGFHRNTQTNTEGGTDDEEFRSAAIIDRTNTTMEVWMGITMSCVQCHTHKYDPIYHEEYYQFYAFFNQTEDADRQNDAPFIKAPTADQQRAIDEVKRQIAAAKLSLNDPAGELAVAARAWEQTLRDTGVDWRVLDLVELSALHGTTLVKQDDGSVFARGGNPPKNTYTLVARTDLSGITAVRLETLADDRLPSRGPGRVGHGNFVINDLQLVAEPAQQGVAPSARFVRIDLPGEKKILSLAEVQVFSGGQNTAPGTQAVQSSTDFSGQAFYAIDGITDGNFEQSMTTHTAIEQNPWWEVDLGQAKPIEKVVVFNRTDPNTPGRLSGATVTLLDAERNPVWQGVIESATAEPMAFETTGRQRVRFTSATATYQHPEWPAALAVDDAGAKGKGWAIHPEQGKDHLAIFETGSDIGFEGGTTLRFTIVQNHGRQHTLGRFRLSVTDGPRPVPTLPSDVQSILAIADDERSEEQTRRINQYFIEAAPQAQAIREKIQGLERQLARLEGRVPTALVMQELPADRQRETYLFNGGSFLAPMKDRGIMEPGTPAVFHAFPEEAPRNRLGLARWLTHAENPLTARVQVNRVWEQIFGIGLVETTNDFGFQGSYPSNKPLLDYLAVTYQRDLAWSTKSLIRLVVTSSSYKQSARASADRLEIDPYNRLISRGPRLRLAAEQIRDQALFVAGLLKHDAVGGPSVMPYLPEGMLPQAFDSYVQQTSRGDDIYRRGLYTAWRRTGHYPSFAAFDAPARDICTVKRPRTNTPLQALVTLNDPVYIEAAQGLARRVIEQARDDFDARIALAFERALARPAREAEVAVLREVYDAALADYRDNPEAATAMATDPRGPLPEGMDAADAAAMTVVGNVILNLDEFINKP